MKKRAYPTWLWASMLCAALLLLALAAPGLIRTQFDPAEAIAAPLFGLDANGTVLPPANGAFQGIFRPPAPFEDRSEPSGGVPLESLASYGRITPETPAIIMWFQAWERYRGNTFAAAAVQAAHASGAIPLISWEPWDPADRTKDSNYQLKDIIDGKHDAYITEFAQDAKAAGGPVMLRPMHEMNGFWYPWNETVNGNKAGEYVQAWRHIHDIFEREGATNVTWVWSINCLSLPDNPSNRNAVFEAYYPGDAYVDWTSISGYNWGTSRNNSQWQTFSQIYAVPLAYLKTKSQPILLSEFGTVSSGGDKAAWLTDAYARIKADPRIKGVVYYDKREAQAGEQDWPVASSWLSWRAYRRAMDDSHFEAGLFGRSPDSPLGMP